MKLNIILISIFIFILLGCKVKDKVDSINSNVDINEIYATNEIDFEIIKEWVKGKRIVSIGESTHGLGEFYSLKSEIVKFLHKDLGYEVLAMEGGLGDINLAWVDIHNLDFLELRNKTLFGNFRCEEIESLFKYLKENSESKNPLFYSGFDTQVSGDYYENNIDSICHHLKLGIDVEEAFSAYNKMYQASFEPDSTNFIKFRNSYQNTLTNIKKAITENENALKEMMNLSDLKLQIILRNLDMQHKAVDYSFADKMNNENIPQGIVIRDKLMADNLQWIIETLYPEKKILIWGHNGHIQKGGIKNQMTKWMGQYLKELYGDNYFSIALFVYKGKVYQHWTGESIEFENSDSTSIEYKMKRDNYKYTFQKFGNKNVKNWTNEEVSAFEIENGGNVTFIPSIRFDAGISIYSGNIPTFENRE